jgi:hypothetical protein
MKIDEMKKYTMFLMGRTYIDIESQIAKKWESHDFADEACKQIATLESPDREVYQFILGVTLGNWNNCSKALEFIEGNLQTINKYQQMALNRMRAMIHIAKGESIEAVEILEKVYSDIPARYSWLKRTVTVDIRNITGQYLQSDKPELIEKYKNWQNLLLKLTDYNPLIDSNDSKSLNTVIDEFFEAGTKLESTVRFGSSIRQVLDYQFRNLFFCTRLGYYTGTRIAKRNIGLILYQWANIHNDSFLYSSALYEFIENGNEAEVEKIFSKHSDVLVGNRSTAILLFGKIRTLSDIPLLQGPALIVAERIYDFLGDDDCEVIDGLLIDFLKKESKDNHSLEMKRLAMKAFNPQSRRIAPVWFLKFAQDKLNKNDEHWWFYLDLFRTLGEIDASQCDKQAIDALVKAILSYFQKKQTFEDLDGLHVLHNLARYSTSGYQLVDNSLFEKYGSKDSAFNKCPLYFTALDHPELLDSYQLYIKEAIRELKDEAKRMGRPNTIAIGTYVTGSIVRNIVQRHFSQLSSTGLFEELADASLNYCLNPNLAASRKRSVLKLIKILVGKMNAPKFWNEKLQNIRDKFNDFSTAIGDRLLADENTTLGALAGSTYLNMGGDLSPSLWNHILRDKVASYENRIDCVDAMSEIAERETPYTTLCFYVLSELIYDEFHMVSREALIRIASLKEFPKDVVPMLCQNIFKASYSGNISIRIAATYCIKKIYDRIGNDHWYDQLQMRLEELGKDDCRPVRKQVIMK